MLNGDLSISKRLVYSDMDKESTLKKEIGLWIDHREAIIVILSEGREEIKHINSNMGKQIRWSSGSRLKTWGRFKRLTSEDGRDRKFGNQLNEFYDEVIRDAETIQIFGGRSKRQVEKRIEQGGINAKFCR
jgi:hypothetical protein